MPATFVTGTLVALVSSVCGCLRYRGDKVMESRQGNRRQSFPWSLVVSAPNRAFDFLYPVARLTSPPPALWFARERVLLRTPNVCTGYIQSVVPSGRMGLQPASFLGRRFIDRQHHSILTTTSPSGRSSQRVMDLQFQTASVIYSGEV